MINRVSRVALMKMLRCASRPLGNVSYSTSLSSATLQMPPCDFQPEAYNGIHYEDALRIRKQNVSPAVFTFYRKPVMVHQGYMQWLWDVTGKRYLDLFAGIVTISVGHCHPKVVNVAERQLKRLWHTTNIYMHSALHEYAEKLVSKLPEDLKVVYFTNSGSEANDLALFMARMHTGTFDAVSPRNAYHGASPYVMGLTALSTWRYNVPTGFGIHQTMNPDPFRGPWGGANCRDSPVQGKEAGGILPISSGKGEPEFGEFIQKRKGNYLVAGHQIKTIRSCDCKEGQCIASDMYIQQLEDVLQFSAPKGKVAAFFAESIQGVGGTVQFPKGYLKGAFEKVRERGGLCISDEVQTGFGRTGTHFWGFESHDVVPDIVTMAKGMGNGFPLGAVVTSSKIASLMGNALHFNTFGGNPMACTIGSAVLDVVEKEKVQENSHTIGTYFLLELAKLRDEFEVIGDVRGKGLMIGVELVTDKESRKPLPAEHVAEIWERTKDLGILVGKGGLYSNVFRIKPPMCITKEDVDFSLDVLRKSLAGYENPVIA